jgi:outer membrane protein
MRKPSKYMSRCLLPALALLISVFSEPAGADSFIRIIGDRTTKGTDHSSGPTAAEPPTSSVRGSSTIRIIGDKTETVPKKVPEQPVAVEITEKEQKTKTAAEEEKLATETAEQMLAQRLAALKAEEERKAAEKSVQERLAKAKIAAAEKAEQERLAKLKSDQEKAAAEAARQAEMKREQEQLAARKAEEERRAAEKAEQERLAKVKAEDERAATEAIRQAAIKKEQDLLATRRAEEAHKVAEKVEQDRIIAEKANEERLAAARRAILEKPLPEIDSPVQQPAPSSPSVDSPTASINSIDNSATQVTGSDNKTGTVSDTIWDLYLSAKANDPALGRTIARVTGSRADSDQLFSTLMPHLDSGAGVQQISQTLSNYNTPKDVSYDYTSLNYNVTARMTLLNVPTIYSLSAYAAGLRVEQAGVAAARQNLIIKFTDSYFALLKAQADKHIAVGEIKRLKRVLEQTRAFLKEGTGDLIAVYEAQSRLDGAEADLTKSESSLRLAEQKLSSVVGKPVTSIVNYLPLQPARPKPDNLDWWVATMEKEQPIVRQAQEGLAQTAEQRKSVKAEYLPVLQASGGYTVSRGTADLPTAEVKQWFIGASLSLPLYSGGETAAKVRRAVASEEERRHIFDETLDQQRENVKQAFYNLRYNISLIKALEQKMASAEIQLDAVKKGRNIGTRNAIDLLNAEQTYSIALRDYKYALYDNFIRVFQLKSAAGILAESDVSEVSKSASPTLSSRLTYFPDTNPN